MDEGAVMDEGQEGDGGSSRVEADIATANDTRGTEDATGSTVPVTVTHLEMTSPDQRSPVPGRSEPTAILRAERPTISFYRYLYDTVGADWNWFMRRRLSDEELVAIIHDDRVEVFVLYVRGVPAGYAELDRRVEGEIEIAYFGLIPEYVGRGFGAFLLHWALGRAWGYRPSRVWLHTCSLDHPRALGVYQRAGLRVYHREVVHEPVEYLLHLPRKWPGRLLRGGRNSDRESPYRHRRAR